MIVEVPFIVNASRIILWYIHKKQNEVDCEGESGISGAIKSGKVAERNLEKLPNGIWKNCRTTIASKGRI